MIDSKKIDEIVTRIATQFNPDKTTFLSKEELEVSLNIAQNFKAFALERIGITE